jgi:hypothetical protein
MTGIRAQAAAPTLPPEVIGSNTIGVIHVDAAHLNPDALQGTATAVLGPNASKVAEQLKTFKEYFDKANTAGVIAVTAVMGSEKKVEGAPPTDGPGKPDSVVYFQLKAGADVKAIEAMATDKMPPAEKEKTVFDQAGDFLAMHPKDAEFPVKPDAARTALFTTALGTIGDAALQVAIVPDDKTRAQVLAMADSVPPAMKDIVPLAAKCQWMTLAVTLGNSPAISLTVDAAADDDGKKMATVMNTGLDDLKKQIANPGPDAGIMVLVGPMVSPLIDGLRPSQEGTQVTTTIKTDALKLIGTIAGTLGLLGGPQ